MSSLLYRLGSFCARRSRWVIAVWLVMLVALGASAVVWGGSLEDDFSIPGSPSQEGIDTLESRFPQASGATAQLVFGAPEGARIDTAPYRSEVDDALERVREVPLVADADDPFESDFSVSGDGQFALVTVQFDVPPGELSVDTLTEVQDAAAASGVTLDVGGQAYTSRGVGLSPIEAVGLVIAFLVLLVMFGSALAAGIPLVMSIVGVGISFAGILVAAALMPVSTATPSLALMIGMAVGIDYGLFILSRHRYELSQGVAVREAVARASATAGSAVTFAGVTVIIALAALSVAGIPFLQVMGLAAAATVATAMLSTLTFLPAMLSVFGERLRPKRSIANRPDSRLSRAWIGITKKHPIMTIVVTSGLLLALLIPAADLRLALTDNGSADPGTPARETYDLIAEEFGPGYNAPLIVTADIITSTDPLGTVDAIEADLLGRDGVAAVTRATPNPSADLALFRVIPEHPQGDQRTIDLVHTLREDAPGIEDEFDVSDLTVTGITAVSIDTSERLTAALLPFALIVVGLSFLLSLLVFRSIAIPLKATFGFVLSASAAFGVVSAIYSWGWFADLLHVQALGPVISFFPIMLISVLFGLSMDYEVFLVARIREEFVRSGDPIHAVDEGYRQSQAVVNAAGIIMIAVFVAFIPHGSAAVKPLAIGLAVGVFVDAFIVRMSLARSILYLLGARAWWLPRWMDRRLPALDVEGAAVEADLHVRAVAEIEGERALKCLQPPMDVRPGERGWYVEPDDLVRHRVTSAIAGRAPAPAGLVVLGHAMPAGKARARRDVVVMTSTPFCDTVEPQVSSSGVITRYLIGRGLRDRSRARVAQILHTAGVPADRRTWTELDKRRLDLALAEASGACLLIVDDLDRGLSVGDSEVLRDAASSSAIPTVVFAVRRMPSPEGEPAAVTEGAGVR